jgi:hypothetical protein
MSDAAAAAAHAADSIRWRDRVMSGSSASACHVMARAALFPGLYYRPLGTTLGAGPRASNEVSPFT